MWSEKQKNGKYKFNERYTDPLTGKAKKVSVVMEKDTATTRKQALAILNAKIDEKLLTAPSKIKDTLTLENLTKQYLAYQKDNVKASTYHRNCTAADSMMRILGKDVLVCKLTAYYIRTKLSDQHEAPGTSNERLVRFKAMIRWGYRNDLIDDIRFIDKIQRFTDVSARSKIKDKYLEQEELTKLLDGMTVKLWFYLTKFLALSGLRIGEAVALDKKDVDFKNRLIHVTKNYDAVNNLLTTPKTECSIRNVYMQDELFRLCKEIDLFMKREALKYGLKRDIFFQRSDGKRVGYYAYNKYLKENAERILNRKKVTPHILRHTHTCLLAENGVPLETISRRLGHEDTKVTKDIYFHVTERMIENDNNYLSDVAIF